MATSKKKLIVIGNGMVGYKFLEYLADLRHSFDVTIFGDEPRPAYDRVQLTSYFGHRNADELQMAGRSWYKKAGYKLLTGTRVTEINRTDKLVTAGGKTYAYDTLVFATGSSAFVPPTPGIDREGVFVYRTIEDLEAIIHYADTRTNAAVMGGGLLGLEAAKALYDLGLRVHVVEYGSHLMARQIDAAGGKLLRDKIESLGVKVHTDFRTQAIADYQEGMQFVTDDQDPLSVDMLVVSAGIRPNDQLASDAGIDTHPRGGILVSDTMQTSDDNIFAIGECAVHDGTMYGLVAPGYRMAETLALGLTGSPKPFSGMHMSTKLKLMGVDVANVGETVPPPGADWSDVRAVVVQDDMAGVYKKTLIRKDGTLMGAVLVGDVSEYPHLLQMYLAGEPLPDRPVSILSSPQDGLQDTDATLVCTCNGVSKGAIVEAVASGCHELGSLCKKTDAGTGCGGCKPQVKQILELELANQGVAVEKTICGHFALSRQELLDVIKVRDLRDYDSVLDAAGQGAGCEVCRPTVASLLASAWGTTAADLPLIQDTNDAFMANIQRGGTYSVVPRIPAGEITPKQLMVIAEVAEEYGLYTKLTGGQRIDLFGATVDQLPGIWRTLVDAGFESGHAYAKGMRTVKSCAGSTWCRFGVLDSVGFAIELENRYKGLRAPHKLKSAVSGCIRECAEARSKDFGIIATEEGWNLYVCGNGGANPKHAILLAGGLDTETCVRYIDRFLMYYIRTAEPLTRTAAWLETLDGGIEYLQQVVIDDKLGISAELERGMQALVGAYQCEWQQVLNDPEKLKRFQSFANTDEADPSIEFSVDRGQIRPASGGGFVELQRIGRIDEHSQRTH